MWKSHYKDKLLFDPNPPDKNNPGYFHILPDSSYFKKQREAIGLTQQEVADKAHINIRQYQMVESGERSLSSTSFRIGISICDVLGLDPHRFI